MPDPASPNGPEGPDRNFQAPVIGIYPAQLKPQGSATERGQYNEIRARTFAEAESIHHDVVDDATVIRMLNKKMNGLDLQFDLNQLPIQEAEQAMARDAGSLGKFHQETTKLIAHYLQIRVDRATVGPKEETQLDQAKADYIKNIREHADRWATAAKSLAQKHDAYSADELMRTGQYWGLKLPVGDKEVEIADFNSPRIQGVRPNIQIQRDTGGQFIHWETQKASDQKLAAGAHMFTKRIYLNPSSEALTFTFENLMQALEQAGIPVRGKMLDRSMELVGMPSDSSVRKRADAIVLAVGDADADRVLALCLKLVETNSRYFADRRTPKIPIRIGPGIAVGDEPKTSGESLSTSRYKLILQAVEEAKRRLGSKPETQPGTLVTAANQAFALNTFRSVLRELAIKTNIDPNNIAFNLEQNP